MFDLLDEGLSVLSVRLSVHLKKKAVVFETSWCVCFKTTEGVLLVTSDVLQVVPLSMAETGHELKSFYFGKVILDL